MAKTNYILVVDKSIFPSLFLCYTVHYVRESEDLMEEARLAVQNIVDNCLQSRMNDWGKIKNLIKDGLSDFLWKKIKRNPVILPVIMEV